MVTNALELSEGHAGPDWCFKGPAKGRHVGQHVVLQACELEVFRVELGLSVSSGFEIFGLGLVCSILR